MEGPPLVPVWILINLTYQDFKLLIPEVGYLLSTTLLIPNTGGGLINQFISLIWFQEHIDYADNHCRQNNPGDTNYLT